MVQPLLFWKTRMITAAKLAGFFAAHAIWCVCDGETVIPMLVYTTDDEPTMERIIISDDLKASVAYGKEKRTRTKWMQTMRFCSTIAAFPSATKRLTRSSSKCVPTFHQV